MKLLYLSSKVYAEFYESNLLDTLAYYFVLRGLHTHKIFLNFTYKSLSLKSGISESCLRKHIAIMRSKGLAKIEGSNLVLLTTKYSKYVYFKKLDKTANVKDYKLILKSIPVLCSFARQATKINSFSNPNAKKLKSNCGKTNGYISLSNATFGSKIKKSKSTVQRYKEHLKSLGILNYRNVYLTLEDYVFYYGELDSLSRIKRVNDNLYVQLSSEYKLDYLYKADSLDKRFVRCLSDDKRIITPLHSLNRLYLKNLNPTSYFHFGS